MSFSDNLENARNFAVNAAQTAAQKAKVLAAIAKANVTIYAEEDKIRKAELQLGKLYYRAALMTTTGRKFLTIRTGG